MTFEGWFMIGAAVYCAALIFILFRPSWWEWLS